MNKAWFKTGNIVMTLFCNCILLKCRPQTLKKLQEYLFFIWDPELPGGENQPMKVLEEGPMDQETYRVSSC